MLDALTFVPMDDADAAAVAGWSYPGIYAFYDFVAGEDGHADLLDSDHRIGRFFSARLPEAGLVGFVELMQGADDEDAVELGLGLRPDLTGQGLGEPFVARICAWAGERAPGATVTLRVAEFNLRALTVYQRAGFVAQGSELMSTRGGRVRFLRLTRPPAQR